MQYQQTVFERTLTVMIPTAADNVVVPGVANPGDDQEPPMEDGDRCVFNSSERAPELAGMPTDDYFAMVVHGTMDRRPDEGSWPRVCGFTQP